MEYKYKAFISYRHLEPDMQAAEKLQKLLEGYKPPKSLGMSKVNWRIFRDVSELQSSTDLSEDIVNAIESSEYLIVICSPKYTESKWCMQELNRFRELHDNTNKNIITLLVSGDPQVSFPEELKYREVVTTDEKGEEVKVKVEVEPLAANITAPATKESLKKLNTEYLRIVAPLLGCDFNDLYQREKRREAARKRKIFGIAFGTLSVITGISVASAVTISNKNVKIKEQNNQIAKKNNDLLIENAGHLAVESENLYKADSLIPAIKKATLALPSDGDDKPVIPEAEYALSKELGAFRSNLLMPELSLKHECAIEKLAFAGDGSTVVSQDATGVYFWDGETGKLLRKISVNDEEFASKANSVSNKFRVYFDNSKDKTGVVFSTIGTPGRTSYEVSTVFNRIYTNFERSDASSEAATCKDVYICNSDSSLWRVDGKTGEVKWTLKASDDASKYYDLIYTDEYILRPYCNKLVMAGGTEMQGKDTFIEIVDVKTGAVSDTVKVNQLAMGTIGFSTDVTILGVIDNLLYVYNDNTYKLIAYEITNHEIAVKSEYLLEKAKAYGIHNIYMKVVGGEPVIVSSNILGIQTESTILRFDKELKALKWERVIPVNYSKAGEIFYMPAADTGYTHDVLAVVTELSLSFVDFETGNEVKTIRLDEKVVDVSYSRRGLVMFIVNSGEEYVVSLGNYTTGDDANNAAYRVQDLNTDISLCSSSKGKYVTGTNYSNTAYVRFPKKNAMYTEIETGEYMYYKDVLATSGSGNKVAVVSTYIPEGKPGKDTVKHLFVADVSDEVSLTEIKDLEDYQINDAAFIGEDTLIVNAVKKQASGTYGNSDETFFADVKTGKVEKIADAPSSKKLNTELYFVKDGVYYLTDAGKNIVFVSGDKKVTSWAEKNEKEIVDSMFAVRDKRAALLKSVGKDSANVLEVYSFDTGNSVALKLELPVGSDLEVQRIFWQSDDTVGVFFNNRSVSFFNAATGELKAEVSLVGTSQEPISVIPLKGDTFAVLCRDSKLYEMNMKGFTGRSCDLEFFDDYDNDIRECDSTKANNLYNITLEGTDSAFAVWKGSTAWLVDTKNFAVRYRIDDFIAAPVKGGKVFVKDNVHDRIGYFPIYSTKQLLDIAKSYLKALGESGKD